MILLHIATGIMLVLLGMRHLRKGLDRLFGNRLVEWLQTMTRNRIQGFLAGIVAGVMAPSSTAIAMLSMQMLNQSALTAGRLLAVVLGANVGITVAVQLLAFRVQDYAGVFIVTGGVAHLFLHRGLFRGIGQVLLALGFIFLAMQMISEAAHAAAGGGDIVELFRLIGGYPWLILAGVALLTVLLQSSTASIGLGIGLAQGGILPAATVFPWVLGANLGIALTALTAGWASVEGRRLGLGNLLLKGTGALGFLLIPSAVALAQRLLPGAVDQQAANFNTFFNLGLGLIALLLLGPLARVLEFLVETPAGKGAAAMHSYLDPLLLQTPSLALNQATREELHMIDEIHIMLRNAWIILNGKDKLLLGAIDDRYGRLNTVHAELRGYLGQISDENLNAEDARWKFILLDYAQELQAIGRLVRRDLADAVSHIELKPPAMAGELQELEVLYAQTLSRLEKAARLLMTGSITEAEQFIREKEEINRRCRAGQKVRPEGPPARTSAGQPVVLVGVAYFDLVTCLRRINGHLTAIAYAIARPGDASANTEGAGSDFELEASRADESNAQVKTGAGAETK